MGFLVDLSRWNLAGNQANLLKYIGENNNYVLPAKNHVNQLLYHLNLDFQKGLWQSDATGRHFIQSDNSVAKTIKLSLFLEIEMKA